MARRGLGEAAPPGAELGPCDAYAELASHHPPWVRRVLALHYALARLALDEWLQPLPPRASLAPRSIGDVEVLLRHLIRHPSLASFAAWPRLFLSNRFVEGNGPSDVTRLFVRFGGPRGGAPNVMSTASKRRHGASLTRWWCGDADAVGGAAAAGGGDDDDDDARIDGCGAGGFEFAVAWRALAPSYHLSAWQWLSSKVQAIFVPDVARIAAPAAAVLLALCVVTADPVLAAAGLALILFAIGWSLLAFGCLFGGTWISVFAYPAFFIALGIGVDDVFVMTHAWASAAPSRRRGGGSGRATDGDDARPREAVAVEEEEGWRRRRRRQARRGGSPRRAVRPRQ